MLRTRLALPIALTLALPNVALARTSPEPQGEGEPVVAASAPEAEAPPSTHEALADAPEEIESRETRSTAPAAEGLSPSTAATPAPTPDVQLAPTPRRVETSLSRKDQTTLLLVGLVTIGIPYTFTSLAGAIVIDKAEDDRRRAYGRALLVPVVGPFFAIGYTKSATSRWAAAFSGTLQVVAAGMLTAAVVATVRRKRSTQRLNMSASFQPGGAAIGVSGRF
jgi:hypothetical protein